MSSAESLKASIKTMLDEAWTEPGFCVPNPTTYPFQWLWDSCFHSLIWAKLGDSRCITELKNTLAHQTSDGFVPHMTYWGNRDAHIDFWGKPDASTITQPPMYGHCYAELQRQGFEPGAEIAAKSRAGLANLLARPKTETGLIPVWHPWETGCDNSARWDDWVGVGPEGRTGFDFDLWRVQKSEYVASLTTTPEGAVVGSDFEVGSVGFNALIAWNVAELASVGESDGSLDKAASEIVSAIAKRWNDELATWTDADTGSGQARTLDALMCALVDPKEEAFEQLVDPGAFGAPFGPRGAHVEEPTYDPDSYWRGPAWPQLAYLAYVAADRAGHGSAGRLAEQLLAGAATSGLAEYWNPENGKGRGAIPQTWAGLAICAG